MLGFTGTDAQRYLDRSIARGINETTIIKSASAMSVDESTFLSYSSKDESHLPGVIAFLTAHGADVYVDKGDSRLPKPPSAQTAQILKECIAQSRGMVVLVSENSKSSTWVPWELGLGDALKRRTGVAILPLAPTDEEPVWASQEYVGLYPRIAWVEAKKYWGVYDPADHKHWSLEQWLKLRF